MAKVAQQLTNPDAVELIAQSLLEKASTPRPLTLPELLRKVKPSISKMLRNGHSYSDVVRILGEHNVETTETVVEAYYSGVKKVKGGKGKSKEISAEAEVIIDAKTAKAIVEAFESQASIRKGLTKEELVAQLREPIEKMLAAHYTYEDISKVMESCGVQISPATLKSYYQGKKRQEIAEKVTNSSSQPTTSSNGTVSSSNLSDKSSELKTPIVKEALSSSKRHERENKRLRESSSFEEDNLEKEFNL
jgi:ribosomal protein L12E/L44/L45/RPP1/RPP2